MATSIILPPAAALEAAAIELNASAPDVKRRIAISKALYDLLISRPAIVRVSGGYLMPSTSRAGLVHRLDDLNGCDCEAGCNGRSCRHATALELIEHANARTMPALVPAPDTWSDRYDAWHAKRAAATEAAALLNECF